ncbi:hypothetical protein N9B72_01255 [Bacteriovoracaceae bacterium]|nr:hypothetical protein [Bacteriovoracaceae bacterium]
MTKLFLLMAFFSISAFAELKIYWSGVAGLYFNDGKHGVFFDPVFNRPSLIDIAFNTKYKLDRKLVTDALNKMDAKIVNAVFVSHSHHDHSIDTPIVSLETGAGVYGTITTRNLAMAHGVKKNKTFLIKHGDTYKFGDFKVEVVDSIHGKIFGLFEFQGGELERATTIPIPIRDYRVGKPFTYILSHQGKKYLIQQASRYTDDLRKRIRGEDFEVIFQGLGNRRSTQDLVDNIWKLTSAKKIVPIHHDNFLFKLKSETSIDYLFLINFEEFLRVSKKNNYQVIQPMYYQQLLL